MYSYTVDVISQTNCRENKDCKLFNYAQDAGLVHCCHIKPVMPPLSLQVLVRATYLGPEKLIKMTSYRKYVIAQKDIEYSNPYPMHFSSNCYSFPLPLASTIIFLLLEWLVTEKCLISIIIICDSILLSIYIIYNNIYIISQNHNRRVNDYIDWCPECKTLILMCCSFCTHPSIPCAAWMIIFI